MARNLVGVVMRQLWDNPPTPSTVITIPDNLLCSMENEEGTQKYYIRQEAEDHKRLFCDRMVEFRTAKWQIHFMEVPMYNRLDLPKNIEIEDL